MLPYTDLPYFVVILAIGLPAVFLGTAERSRCGWILVATALMAVVNFGPSRTVIGGRAFSELWIALAFSAFQLGLVAAFARSRVRRRSNIIFGAAILLSAAPLIAVKVMTASGAGAGPAFLGISYVTFRAVDALIIVQDRLETRIEPGTYLAYLMFPATISAGPIDRYRRFAEDYRAVPERGTFLAGIDEGVSQIFRGLLYKFVIAALIQKLVFPRVESPGFVGAVEYMYAYSFYLFFDFAGYSAIATGVSRFFGVRTPGNFNRPFAAVNIVDFWNRWHISLSTWFRDHIYMRFALAAARGRWFGGNRYIASHIGFLLTFLLMGAWHGLEQRYILYGVYHATLLIGHSIVVRWTRRWPRLRKSRSWQLLGFAVTFNAVCLGFLLFSGRLDTSWTPEAFAP